MRLFNMIGYKLFKENEDGSIHMVRIVNMRKPFKITQSTPEPEEITIFDYDDNERKKVKVSTLKDYSPLDPDGILSINIATVRDSKGKPCKDVIVTAAKFLNIKFGLDMMPYAVCRQNITDIFYNLLIADESEQIVGLSINQDTCPANFDFGIMFAADSVGEHSDFINFYRTDTLDDIMKMVNKTKYDEVLSDLYSRHVKAVKKPELMFKHEDGGWCKDLMTLLTINNFQADINQMLGIMDVDFNINDFVETETIYRDSDDTKFDITKADEDLKSWLSLTYKINIKEANILEFDHDINLADFNNATYLLIRDNTKKLYLIVYLADGEFFEADLLAKAKELDFSTKFKIKFYDKYNSNNK